MTALANVPPASTFGTERRLLAAAMDLQATLACRVNDLAACISHHDACAAGQLSFAHIASISDEQVQGAANRLRDLLRNADGPHGT